MRHSYSTLVALGLGAALVVSCAGAPDAPAPPRAPAAPIPLGAWRQVWSDEFDGPPAARIDSTKWIHDRGDGCAVGICGWGNAEKQSYTDDVRNVGLDGNGHLAIVARAGSPGYTSGRVRTKGRMAARPGRVEARVRSPAGQGLWPAFWMLGDNHPATPWPQSGEIDIMEHKGSNPRWTSSAIHGPGYSGKTPFVKSYTLSTSTFAEGFHTFAVEWDNLRVRFFIDDAMHYEVARVDVERSGPWVFDQSFYVLLNLAVGGQWDGDPQSNAIFPATMLVDYVRVFERGP